MITSDGRDQGILGVESPSWACVPWEMFKCYALNLTSLLGNSAITKAVRSLSCPEDKHLCVSNSFIELKFNVIIMLAFWTPTENIYFFLSMRIKENIYSLVMVIKSILNEFRFVLKISFQQQLQNTFWIHFVYHNRKNNKTKNE